jgi:hypothetical protein
VFFLCFVVVLCIFIFVCTSVGILPPGESPIAVSNNNSNNNNNYVVGEGAQLIKSGYLLRLLGSDGLLTTLTCVNLLMP